MNSTLGGNFILTIGEFDLKNFCVDIYYLYSLYISFSMEIANMKWKSISESKPNKNCVCWVTNTKFTQQCKVVLYNVYIDCFYKSNEPDERFPLEVTHWVELPYSPKDEDE